MLRRMRGAAAPRQAAAIADDTFRTPAFNPATYLVAVEEDTGEYIGLVRIWMNRSGPRIGMSLMVSILQPWAGGTI
jgi:hypothetical protein